MTQQLASSSVATKENETASRFVYATTVAGDLEKKHLLQSEQRLCQLTVAAPASAAATVPATTAAAATAVEAAVPVGRKQQASRHLP